MLRRTPSITMSKVIEEQVRQHAGKSMADGLENIIDVQRKRQLLFLGRIIRLDRYTNTLLMLTATKR